MVDKTKIGALITAIVALIIAGGGELQDQMTVEDAVGELDGYYICDVVGEDSIKEYARLSGTKYTAYPYADSGVGRVYCKAGDGTRGTWHTLSEYAEDLGLSLNELLLQLEEEPEVTEPEPVDPIELIPFESTPYEGNAPQVKCGQNGCYTV